MKIMVYTYGIPFNTPEQSELIKKKEDYLKGKFPGIHILVVPGPFTDGDKVQVVDLFVPYPPTGTATYPNWIWPTTPAVNGIPLTGTGTCGGGGGSGIGDGVGTTYTVFTG